MQPIADQRALHHKAPAESPLGWAMVHRNSFFFSPSYLCGRTYFFVRNKAISGIYSLLPLPPIGPSRGADKGRDASSPVSITKLPPNNNNKVRATQVLPSHLNYSISYLLLMNAAHCGSKGSLPQSPKEESPRLGDGPQKFLLLFSIIFMWTDLFFWVQ
ncbi:hypothetical protein CEXT_512691 [Caerostris extrusa]|uniref:Uncharacterized protein n=1 Tax=Caerostris extrusa TaxID=172846 RepID=A0AAV4MRM4_CAEEX|nr:hypothetical protein CEXT_512691 [Caerostris extrusa]